MANKLKEELKGMSLEELHVKIGSLRSDLFSLKLRSVTQPAKDTSEFAKLRKGIACALTLFAQKLGERAATAMNEETNG